MHDEAMMESLLVMTYLVPSFRLTLTIALNVAAIAPMVAGRFCAIVPLVLSTCTHAQPSCHVLAGCCTR